MSKDPPPIPNFPPPPNYPPPLTPPQKKRVSIIKEAKKDLKRPIPRDEDALKKRDEDDIRLSTLAFNAGEMKKIRDATIKAFKDDFAYAKSDQRESRYPNQGPLDIINSIAAVLADKKPSVKLGEQQKEELINKINDTYKECKRNYQDTHILGVNKNNKEKAKTAAAMVLRVMKVAIGVVGAAIGKAVSYLGKRDLEKGMRIEREANETIAEFDESKYEDYNNPEIDELEEERKRGEEIQEKALDSMSIKIGSFLFQGADMVERVKQKNMSVSKTVSSALNITSGKKNKGRSRG